jgi:tetratricopeptide (TPR) repeat protein
MQPLIQDLRYGSRRLVKRPGFTLPVIIISNQEKGALTMSKPNWVSKTICLLTLPVMLVATGLHLSVLAQAPTPNTFQETLKRAEASSNLKQWSEAATHWGQVVEANPLVASYWNQLGIARYNNRDCRGAIQAYQRALALGFMPAMMAYSIASCHGLLGEKQQALEWVDRSLALGYTRPQRMLRDENLQLLRAEARFKTLLGADDVSKLSRVEGWRYDLDLFVRELKRMHPNPYRARASMPKSVNCATTFRN